MQPPEPKSQFSNLDQFGYRTNFDYFKGMGGRQGQTTVRRSLFFLAVYYLLSAAFMVWYEWVVYRAYLYMKLCKETERQQREQHPLTSVRATATGCGEGGCHPGIPGGPTGYYSSRPPPGYQPVQQMGGGMEQGVYWQKGPQGDGRG